MVVDNDPDVAGLVRDFLEASGFEIHLAQDGLAGLELFAQLEAVHRAVDLIVLDLRMPELDGQDFLHRLQARWSVLPPVILISGFISERDRAGFAASELVFGILEKPFDLLDLERMARQAVQVAKEESPGLWSNS